MLEWDQLNPIPSVYTKETGLERTRAAQATEGKGTAAPIPLFLVLSVGQVTEQTALRGFFLRASVLM